MFQKSDKFDFNFGVPIFFLFFCYQSALSSNFRLCLLETQVLSKALIFQTHSGDNLHDTDMPTGENLTAKFS